MIAGFCIITLVLGIGDRHLDNLMVNNRGKYFNRSFTVLSLPSSGKRLFISHRLCSCIWKWSKTIPSTNENLQRNARCHRKTVQWNLLHFYISSIFWLYDFEAKFWWPIVPYLLDVKVRFKSISTYLWRSLFARKKAPISPNFSVVN